ncbi:MAG: phasin family protein [Anaerolineae bacterium]
MVTKVKEAASGVKETARKAASEMEGSPMLEAAHKVLLAGIGAVALAQDEIEDFVDKLIERGEIAEKDGRKMLKDVLERRRKQAKKAEGRVEKRLEELLGRMNVPSKADIDALEARVAELTKKVEELKKGGA